MTIIMFLAGLGLLIFGADLFTDSAVDAAKKLRMTPFVLALLVAGAEPEEMIAAAVASAKGMGELAASTAVGTNICIIAFALALAAVIMPVKVDKQAIRHGLIALACTLPPLLFLTNLRLNRWEGGILVALFFAYVLYAVTRGRIDIEIEEISTRELMGQTAEEAVESEQVQTRSLAEDDSEEESRWKPVLLCIGGVLVMGFGGDWLVQGAGGIMDLLHLSEAAVGLTFVSLATSAEMIALAIVPLYKGHPEITVGGIIGSYIYNLLLTLGAAGLVHPILVQTQTLTVDFVVMTALLAFTLLAARKGSLSRANGIILLACYAAYLYFTFTFR